MLTKIKNHQQRNLETFPCQTRYKNIYITCFINFQSSSSSSELAYAASKLFMGLFSTVGGFLSSVDAAAAACVETFCRLGLTSTTFFSRSCCL
ncbi:hypothetical protein Hanom_Chr04g00385111 [Helianthus anomalus]